MSDIAQKLAQQLTRHREENAKAKEQEVIINMGYAIVDSEHVSIQAGEVPQALRDMLK